MLAEQPACDRQPLPLPEGEVAGADSRDSITSRPSRPFHSSSSTARANPHRAVQVYNGFRK